MSYSRTIMLQAGAQLYRFGISKNAIRTGIFKLGARHF